MALSSEGLTALHEPDSNEGSKYSESNFTLDATQDDQRFVRDRHFRLGCELLRACGTGDEAKVAQILTAEPRMSTFKDYDGRTALHVAASEGRLALVGYLLNQGAQINVSDRWGGSPLDDAMRHRHDAVQSLLRRSGGRLGVSGHGEALILAASRGEAAEVEALLTDGADPTAADYDQRTALHLTCSEGHERVAALLITAGAKLDAIDRWGNRPADDAHRKGNATLEAMLMAAGAPPLAEKRLSLGGGSGDSPPRALGGGHSAPTIDALAVEWADVTMLEKIGSGAFGDIWKCRWRGTLVAAKVLKDKGNRSREVTPSAIEVTGLAAALTAAGRISPAAAAAFVAAAGGGATQPADERRMSYGTSSPSAGHMPSGGGGGGGGAAPGASAVAHPGTRYMSTEHLQALADLKQEIGLLGQLRHPNICLLLGYSLAYDREVMISELMKCSLFDVFKTLRVTAQPMPLRRSLRYAIQFAQGMNYLHTCKPPVLHRDLKPANLLLDFSDTLKVADFGLAKLRPVTVTAGAGHEPEAASREIASEYQPALMTGETGSYRFMAPEVFRHEAYGRPVDVYSFAMIMYNMLGVEPPWPELSGPEAVKRSAMQMDRPPLPRHWDATLAQLIRSCWLADPAGRPSFSAVLEQLAEVFTSIVGTSYEEYNRKVAVRIESSHKGCCTLS